MNRNKFMKKRDNKQKFITQKDGGIPIQLEQFIGIFPHAIDNNICANFLECFNIISQQGLTLSSGEESGMPGSFREDEVVQIPKMILPNEVFPDGLTIALWKDIGKCRDIYYNEYNIDNAMTSYGFKIHRVQPTGGYHEWHHEHWFNAPYRILAWHLTLEAPEKGGETEFLFQSMRVDPKVGQLVIWPAAFTHKHRGNPPLKGQKTYMTGWFDLTEPPQ